MIIFPLSLFIFGAKMLSDYAFIVSYGHGFPMLHMNFYTLFVLFMGSKSICGDESNETK